MARPQIEIDPKDLEKLAAMGCSMKEMAAFCECSVDTLERRFADVIHKGRESGKTSLRRLQWQSAQKGNVTMQIFLGKQLLGQSDKLTTVDKTPESTGSSEERKARIELIKRMAREGSK